MVTKARLRFCSLPANSPPMSKMSLPLAAIAVAAFLSACQSQSPAVADRTALASSPHEAGTVRAETLPLTIRSGHGEHRFDVEVARTDAEQTRGLMFRESLPENGGMLFPFDRPRMASFWMRNTLIPLDMIFVRPDGTISNIARRTTPYTLDTYRSTEPVIAVLEIDGGRAQELGIDADDRASWPGGPDSQE